MPSQDFIDVRVYVIGQPLVEYPDPDSEGDDDQKMSRYVEVKAGQRFEVHVTLLPGFEFRFASHVYIELEIDQDSRSCFYDVAYEDVQTIRGMLQVPQTRKFEYRMKKAQRTGMWINFEFEFGALGVNEHSMLPKDLSPSDLALLGSIRIKVTRTREQKRAQPYFWDGEVQQPLDEVSERALKGKYVRNNVKYISDAAMVPQRAPPPILFNHVPIKGKRGKPYNFTFLYRNKKILQSLGCIPRSPSPPPDTTLILQRTEDALRMTKQKARRLEEEHKSQITRLEERLSRAEALIRSGSESNPASRASTVAPSVENSANMASLNQSSNSQVLAGAQRMHADIDDDEVAENAAKRVRSETVRGESVVRGLGTARVWSTAPLANIDEDDDVLEAMPPPPKPRVVIDLTDD